MSTEPRGRVIPRTDVTGVFADWMAYFDDEFESIVATSGSIVVSVTKINDENYFMVTSDNEKETN